MTLKIMSRGDALRSGLAGLALVLVGLPAGCANGNGGMGTQPRGRPTSQVTAQQAWLALSNFQDSFEQIIRDASRRMMDDAGNNRARRASLEWKIYGLRLMRDALKKDEPIAALLDAWALTVQMKQYNEREAGALSPGAGAAVLEASDAAVAQIEIAARRILQDADFKPARDQIYEFAAENPVSGVYSALSPQPPSQAAAGIPILSPLLSIPMAPFHTAKGIDRGAQAIYEFTKVAMRFTDVVESLPEEWNWQLQLVLLDLAENEVIQSILASTAQFSESTRQFAETADRLTDTLEAMPQNVRQETQEVLEELAERQAELQATLEKIEASANAIDTAVQRVRDTTPEVTQAVQSTADAGHQLAEAANAIRDMVAYFRSLSAAQEAPPSGPPGEAARATSPPTSAPAPEEPKRGFDVRDYDAAAQSIAEAARELQVLTDRLEDLVEGQQLSSRIEDLDQRLTASITRAADEADAVVAGLVWRLGGLALGVFVLALVYRLVTSRRRRQNT